MTTLLEHFRRTSSLSGGNAAFVEQLYEHYLQAPDDVPEDWRRYFANLQQGSISEVAHGPIRASFVDTGNTVNRSKASSGTDRGLGLQKLVDAYRQIGHRAAQLDPLGLQQPQAPAELSPAAHGISPAAGQQDASGTNVPPEWQKKSAQQLLASLKQTYCGSIGLDCQHVSDRRERQWFYQQMEHHQGRLPFEQDQQQVILQNLVAANEFEAYLQKHFPAQKRFSLEGSDGVIPLLDDMIQQAGQRQVKEIVIGMAHRGRLNVMVNITGKSSSVLIKEFQSPPKRKDAERSGDVKYHMGFSSNVQIGDTKEHIHLSLAFNPSHLEIVNPVVEGSARARMERRQRRLELDELPIDSVIPVLIHGDSAFSGQGVVMETLQLSQVRGYRTGGTVHIILNNQIGFTTSNPQDTRSTHYCSDVAKMIEAPVLHVNGDDPEAVLFANRLALAYRMTFHKDVVVDLVTYRRRGHNEVDPADATQPLMYQAISQHPTPARRYANQLISNNRLQEADYQKMVNQFAEHMVNGSRALRRFSDTDKNPLGPDWHTNRRQQLTESVQKTGISLEKMRKLNEQLLQPVPGFQLQNRVEKLMDERRKMAAGALAVDWGFAETLAYASLLDEGHGLRLSGQDAQRGTFFHRHSALHNQKDGAVFLPLSRLTKKPASLAIINSLLSEEAVMGFEYGHSTTDPDALTIWEGQFGDFANGAQVVIDQFIASGETKWGRYCGLVLLLPHGYEGMGPEHSSARLERFLQLCAEHNMQVCVPTTPAQVFHMLRRQKRQPAIKPLVVMTPKSLLRHPLAKNALDDLSQGGFQLLIPEIDEQEDDAIERVVFCSGKVYYDLLQARRKQELQQVAIVRIEQLYPFPKQAYRQQIERYTNAKDFVWCQEEPQNQGAWFQIFHKLTEPFQDRQESIRYAGRAKAASPAVGYHTLHTQQQEALVQSALLSH